MPRPPALLLAAVLGALLGACATPVAPSGGPPDTTPPALVGSLPARGATQVSAHEVVLTFSERLDPASATSAVRVTPEPSPPPRVTVRGSELIVALDSLRPDATVVVTVGTTLKDARQVALRAPVVVAFSTGDRIDAGRIAGIVRSGATGAPASGFAVWAYALSDASAAPPDPATTAPDYRTESTADGSFLLDYLRPGPYAVAAVQDRSRNGRADAGETVAVAPMPALLATEADTTAARDSTQRGPVPFWTTVLDTIPPTPRSVRALTDRRVAVRFSESVRLRDVRGFVFTDSTTGRTVGARAGILGASPAEVVVVADEALPPRPLRLRAPAGAVTDSAGVAAPALDLRVTPAARPDTLVARLLRATPADSLLAPGDPLVLRWSAPPDADALAAVSITDVSGIAITDSVTTDDGIAFRYALSSPGVYTVRADTSAARRVTVLGPDALGSVVGRVADAAGRRVVVEAVAERQPFGPDARRVVVGTDGRFEISGLRPGPVRLRLFADTNGDGTWTGGQLSPYVAPEPLAFVAEPAVVRARWETDAGDLLLDP